MGCCQGNLSISGNPHERKKFIDHIKQSSVDSKSHLINNQPPQLENIPQSSQQYEYSRHGVQKCEQFEDSQVSIFEQERKRLEERSRKRLHVEIHPDVIERENKREIEKLLRQSQLVNGGSNQNNKVIKKGTIFPMSQQLLLSNIKENDQSQIKDKQQPHQNGQQFYHQQQQSQLLSNFQQHMANNRQIQLNGNNKQSNKYNNRQQSQTDRQLMELHGQLTTMIILWEKLGNGTKRLKVEEMNSINNRTQRDKSSINRNNQKPQNQLVNKNNTNDKNDNFIVDKQLMDIWNQQQNLVSNNLIQNVSNNNNNIKDENKNYHNDNNNIDLHDHLPITSQQMPTFQIKNNIFQQPPTPITNIYNDLSLRSSTQSQLQISQKQQQQQEQKQSKCLLSNPTKILNDSLISEFSQQKEMFYFGRIGNYNTNHNQNQSQSTNMNIKCYQKWTETDRKAYEVKNQDILSLFDKKGLKTQQIYIKNTLLPILCVIKCYYQQNKVNLIAYRTMTSTSIFFQAQQNSVKLPKNSGFRIFYNGIKRLYPFQQTFDGTELFSQLQKMFLSLFSQKKSSSQLIYNLTGWIPQTIMVSQISNFEGVFQRLNSNFVDGNTVITFTGRGNQLWGLKSIDVDKKQIELFGHNNLKSKQTQKLTEIKKSQQFEQTYKWSEFMNMIREINVNWNPLIYDYMWRSQNVFYFDQVKWNQKDNIGNYDEEYIQSMSHQYLLKIPPLEDDIEVRVFLEIHYRDIIKDEQQKKNNSQNQSDQQNDINDLLVIELHDYSGTRINSSTSAIRKVQKSKYVFSDMLIFQSSKQITQYVIAVRPFLLMNNSESKTTKKPKEITKRNQLKYTISAFTFMQVSLQQIPATRVLQQKVISTYLQQSHCGYGINSPYFLNNFYLQLKIPPLQKIKIFVSMPVDDCKFELNLIANPDGEENLTRLNLENILGDIVTSEEFQQGKGYLQIESKYDEYFFMITNHTKCKGEFNIIIQVIDNIPRYLTLNKLKQIQSNIEKKDKQLPSLIYSKQKFFYQQPIFTKEFKWLVTHTGPRKRLKSNTHSGYQPFAAFKQFFKNPFIDYKVDKYKKLQFSVYSKSYQDYFDSLQEQEKNQAQPSTISLTILKVKRPNEITSSTSQKNILNQSLFKIIVDDAFYVPFGFGFWTKILEIQAGQYRFVFPKMEKQFAQGVFNVYHIEK